MGLGSLVVGVSVVVGRGHRRRRKITQNGLVANTPHGHPQHATANRRRPIHCSCPRSSVRPQPGMPRALSRYSAHPLQWMRRWNDKKDADDTPPPLRTHSLPPPLPSARPEKASQSDTDAESFDDILSPAPTHDVLSRRSSVRAHDLFAASHISFSELGSLVAPQNE